MCFKQRQRTKMARLLLSMCVYMTLRLGKVSGAQMTIQPSTALMGSGPSPEVTMICSLSPGEASADIASINLIRIARNRTIDHRDYFIPIAMKLPGVPATIVQQEPDVYQRAPTVSGTMKTDPPALNVGELKLVWQPGQIECSDDGDYQCDISYLDGNYQNHNVVSAARLQVKATSSDLKLEASVNGTSVDLTGGPSVNHTHLSVGDTIDMTCSGDVGTDPNTTIDWYHTNPHDTRDRFQLFFPEKGDVIDEGSGGYSQTHCGYVKSNTLHYTVRQEDAHRQNDLMFKCATTKMQGPHQQLIVWSDKSVSIKVTPLTTTTTTTTTTTKATTVATTTTQDTTITTQATTTIPTTSVPMTSTAAVVTTIATSPPTAPKTTIATTHATTNSGEGPLCLSCKSVIQPRHCHKVERCLADQICATKLVLDEFGDEYYDVGCMNVDICNRHRVKRDQSCTQCCQGDLCNVKGCGQPDYPHNFGPVCFACNMLPKGGHCHSVTVCQNHQICYTEHIEEFGDVLVHRGCKSEQFCHDLTSSGGVSGSQIFVGRRSLIDGSGVACARCCHDNVCNEHCEQSTCQDTTSTCPYLASTLNICSNATMASECALTCGLCNGGGAGYTVPPTSAPSTAPLTTEAATPSTTHSTRQMTTSEPSTTSTTTIITSPMTSQKTTATTTQVASPQTTTTAGYCSDVLSESLCKFVMSTSTACGDVHKATSTGCLASCGYCGSTTSVSQATTAIKRDCLDIYKSDPQAPSGKYEVTVTLSDGSTKPLDVWCDMTHGGGWTVFQKRFDGREDFYKGIKHYENGFGNVDGGEFWLGLEHMHQLTAGAQSTLRVDVLDHTGAASHDEYSGFSVDAGPEYRLHVGSRTQGNADGKMHYYDGAPFSTHDMDRDTFTSGNCAERFHGAFWYQACLRDSNVNGIYKPGSDSNCLYYAMTYSDCNGNRAIEMKFRRNA